MEYPGFELSTILLGIAVFLARVADVSIGTMRTISIIQGRVKTAFVLGFFEIIIWLVVIAKVLDVVLERPLLAIFYSGGFATGSVVGIMIERRIAMGHTVLRIFNPHSGKSLATRIRQGGYSVTTFEGEGLRGPVTELYIVCRRRDIRKILKIAREAAPDSYYVIDQGCDVSSSLHPTLQQPTGWRSVFKKK